MKQIFIVVSCMLITLQQTYAQSAIKRDHYQVYPNYPLSDQFAGIYNSRDSLAGYLFFSEGTRISRDAFIYWWGIMCGKAAIQIILWNP